MLLASAYLWRRLMVRTTFIAITGSVGKTTTKDLIAATLSGLPAATFSNFGSENTTQEIARTLLRVRPWHRFAVFEVASGRPGMIRSGARMVSPQIAVILSVARIHTNHFVTLEDTAAEKATLLRFLRRGGAAVLNADDSMVAAMAPASGARVIRFGSGPEADVRAENVGGDWPDRLSMLVSLHTGGSEQVQSQLVGLHWTSAFLATIAVALQCGMSLKQIVSRIAEIPPTAGRMDPQVLPNGAVILRDEFNGSLDTFHAAFEVLRAARAERKILVVTTVIDTPESWDQRTKRIAREAAGVVNMLVLVGSLDTTKKAARTARSAGLAPAQVRVCRDPREAAAFLRSELRSGDLVLLRGRVQDHLTRLYYAQLSEVACWKETCQKRKLCDHCSELFEWGQSPKRDIMVVERGTI